jgi:hypothetical protein
MQQVNTMTASPKLQSFRSFDRHFLNNACIVTLMLWSSIFLSEISKAETTATPGLSRTTMVIFSDKRMQDEQWAALFAALRRDRASFVSTVPELAGDVQLLRGDQVKPGLQVTTVITVFLRGDCTLIPRPRRVVFGALGWAPRSKMGIDPFINVNCSLLVDMLGPMSLSMSRSVRINVMAEAITHVILHEWIHIATQSARHSAHGVMRDQFGVADLLADMGRPQAKHKALNEGRKPRISEHRARRDGATVGRFRNAINCT